MTHWLLIAACLPACIVGFRIRGGVLAGTRIQTPGQVSRLLFAIPAALTALTCGLVWWQALCLVPLWFAGETEPLFSSTDLGSQNGSFWGDFGLLALHGVLLAAPAAALLGYFGGFWPALLASGSLMAPAYLVARAIPLKLWGLGDKDSTQWGEALTGALLWAGTAVAILAA